MIVRVIIQEQYKNPLENNEWFVDMGDWRNAEGYVSSKLFGWWRLKYDYSTILMSELLDNGIKNDDHLYEISDIEWFLLKDTTKAQLVEGRNILISNSAEAFLYGMSETHKMLLDDPHLNLNSEYFNMSEDAKRFVVVWDNIDPTIPNMYPHIDFVNTDWFLLEAISHVDTVTDRWVKEVNGIQQNTSTTRSNPIESYAPWLVNIPNYRVAYDKFI